MSELTEMTVAGLGERECGTEDIRLKHELFIRVLTIRRAANGWYDLRVRDERNGKESRRRVGGTKRVTFSV